MEQQKVIFSENLRQTLEHAVSESAHDRLLVLVDETTRDCCLPVVRDYDCMKEAQVITIRRQTRTRHWSHSPMCGVRCNGWEPPVIPS